MKSKLFIIGLILSSILALPSASEAGFVRRFLARRAAPRATAVQVNVAVRRGVAVQRNVAARRGAFGRVIRHGR